jgi:hypothetical protein
MVGIVKGWMLENELKIGVWSKFCILFYLFISFLKLCEMFACGWFEAEIEYDLRCNVLFT